MGFTPRPAPCAEPPCIPGGLAGQWLKKLSDTECLYDWADLPSGSGGDAPRYLHSQDSPDTTWTVNHNLTLSMVNVQVKDNLDQHVICDVVESDANTVVLTFSSPTMGKALIT